MQVDPSLVTLLYSVILSAIVILLQMAVSALKKYMQRRGVDPIIYYSIERIITTFSALIKEFAAGDVSHLQLMQRLQKIEQDVKQTIAID